MRYTSAVPYYNNANNYIFYLLVQMLKLKTVKNFTDKMYKLLMSSRVFVFDKGITKIEKHTLYLCTFITEITVPDTVRSIHNQAFQDCRELVCIKYLHPGAIVDKDFYPFYRSQHYYT